MTQKHPGKPFDVNNETITVVGTLDENNNVVRISAGGGAGGEVTDSYNACEVLADQSGANAVLTFNFSAVVNLVWVRSVGGASRVHPTGGTPTASYGIRAPDDEPIPITVETSEVKVWAPSTAAVTVWGFRY